MANLKQFFLPIFLSSVFSILSFGLFSYNQPILIPIFFALVLVLAYLKLGKLETIIAFLASFILFFLTVSIESFYIVDMHLALIVLSALLLWKKDLKTTLKALAIPGDLKKNIIYGVVGFFLVIILSATLTVAMSNLLGSYADAQKIAQKVDALPVYILLMAILVAPISEELFFRAVLTERFGIIISSLAFMVSHISYGSITELIGAFVLGILFAVVYKKTKSVTPCIIMHFLYNLAALLTLGVF